METYLKTISVKTDKGETFAVIFEIPKCFRNKEEEWRYVCDWIDEHLKDIVEWND